MSFAIIELHAYYLFILFEVIDLPVDKLCRVPYRVNRVATFRGLNRAIEAYSFYLLPVKVESDPLDSRELIWVNIHSPSLNSFAIFISKVNRVVQLLEAIGEDQLDV